MAGSSTLAKRYVEFLSRGVPNVIADSNKIRAKIREEISDSAKLRKEIDRLKQSRAQSAIVARAEAALMTRGQRFDAMANKAATGFAILTASTMGWVAAGMAGTVEAYQLQQSIMYLSREIAGIFKPTIDSIIKSIRDLTQWFRGLSAEQQGHIRKIVIWSAAIMGGIVALNAMRKALLMARAMALAFQASLGPIGWAMILVGVVLAQNESRWHVLERIINRISDAFGPLLDSLESTMNVLDNITKFKMPEMKDIKGGADKDASFAKRLASIYTFGVSDVITNFLGLGKKSEDKKKGGDRNQLALDQTGFESIGAAWDRVSEAVLRQDPMRKISDDVAFIRSLIEGHTRKPDIMSQPPREIKF